MSDQLQHEDLSKEVIAHLSKEIETLTNNNNLFRSRASLSVFLGPFIVLGSFVVSLRGSDISFHPNTMTWILIGLVGLGFLSLGWMSGMVELHAWRLCNRYRQVIARLHNDPRSTIEPDELLVRYRPKLAYLVVYGLMLLTFASAAYIASRLDFTERQTKPPQLYTAQPAEGRSESVKQGR